MNVSRFMNLAAIFSLDLESQFNRLSQKKGFRLSNILNVIVIKNINTFFNEGLCLINSEKYVLGSTHALLLSNVMKIFLFCCILKFSTLPSLTISIQLYIAESQSVKFHSAAKQENLYFTFKEQCLTNVENFVLALASKWTILLKS